MDIILPPVLQCKNGHLFCNECFHNLIHKKCPVCTTPLGIDQMCTNLAIQNHYAKHTMECPHTDCQYVTTYEDMMLHKRNCKLCPFQCEVCNRKNQSRTEYTIDTIREHIIEKHNYSEIGNDGLTTHQFNLLFSRQYDRAVKQTSSKNTQPPHSGVFLWLTTFNHGSQPVPVLICLKFDLKHRRGQFQIVCLDSQINTDAYRIHITTKLDHDNRRTLCQYQVPFVTSMYRFTFNRINPMYFPDTVDFCTRTLFCPDNTLAKAKLWFKLHPV